MRVRHWIEAAGRTEKGVTRVAAFEGRILVTGFGIVAQA
jgi:hypothetical protein